MKLLKRGAEAELYLSKFDGKNALLKKRVRKGYRHSELDEEIRHGRTGLEAKLLNKARKLGVKTPQVYKVDRASGQIVMEFIGGGRVKDILDRKNFEKICLNIGKDIAKMHSFNLIHGDLTTSNILLGKGGLFFIDFGLGTNSGKVEDKAVDLLVFRKTFEATHADLMPKGWEKIIKGYTAAMEKEGKRIVEHIARIEKRARYN